MTRTVKEIVAERDARIEALRATYPEDIKTESRMLADQPYNMSAEARSLNRKINEIANEYRAELLTAEEYERSITPTPDWMREIFADA